MNWKYTNVHHGFRRKAGITMNEYGVLDIIYQSHTHPKSRTEDGWGVVSYKSIADFLALSKGAVFKIVERTVAAGLMEVDPANPNRKRTTPAWYENAYLDEEDKIDDHAAEKVKNGFTLIKGVQKVNGGQAVQKVNDSVQKVNANRSKSERHTNEEKKEKEEKSFKVELGNSTGNKDLEKLDKRLTKKNEKFRGSIIEIVDYYREVTGQVKTNYSTNGALKLLLHWLNDGSSVEDFKLVIDYKTNYFKSNRSEENINLDTFCRLSKFEDNLEKARKIQDKIDNVSSENADVELSENEKKGYDNFLRFCQDSIPTYISKFGFLKHSEFRDTFSTKEYFPMWRKFFDKASYRNEIKKAVKSISQNSYAMNTAGNLNNYLQTAIKQSVGINVKVKAA